MEIINQEEWEFIFNKVCISPSDRKKFKQFELTNPLPFYLELFSIAKRDFNDLLNVMQTNLKNRRVVEEYKSELYLLYMKSFYKEVFNGGYIEFLNFMYNQDRERLRTGDISAITNGLTRLILMMVGSELQRKMIIVKELKPLADRGKEMTGKKVDIENIPLYRKILKENALLKKKFGKNKYRAATRVIADSKKMTEKQFKNLYKRFHKLIKNNNIETVKDLSQYLRMRGG